MTGRYYNPEAPDELRRQLQERDDEVSEDISALGKYDSVKYIRGDTDLLVRTLYVAQETGFTVKLPEASSKNAGKPIGVIVEPSSGSLTVQAIGGDTINNGASSSASTTQSRSFLEFVSDGISGWWHQ